MKIDKKKTKFMSNEVASRLKQHRTSVDGEHLEEVEEYKTQWYPDIANPGWIQYFREKKARLLFFF